MEAGLDSLTAVELRNSLATAFSVDLPATVMFDYPTVDALAGFVAERVAPPPQQGGALAPVAAVAIVDAQKIADDVQDIVTGGVCGDC
jgi:hypothetical protein